MQTREREIWLRVCCAVLCRDCARYRSRGRVQEKKVGGREERNGGCEEMRGEEKKERGVKRWWRRYRLTSPSWLIRFRIFT